MKNLYYFLIIFILVSCNKDDIKYEDTFLHFKYTIELDELNRIISYCKMNENNSVIDVVNYFFANQKLLIEKYNSNELLVEKTVFNLATNGNALNSVDTIYGRNIIIIKKYNYQANFLTNIEGVMYTYENSKIIDSIQFYIIKEIKDGGINKVSTAYESPSCKDQYANFDVTPKIDVLHFNNGVLGNIFKLPKTIELSIDCPCGPSSEYGTKNYEYIFDDNERITKIIEKYKYCQRADKTPIYRQITTSEFEYYNR